MDKLIKFSVLMSLYDKEVPELFEKCLKSIVEQTLLPDEIVIVFDGPISENLLSVLKDIKTDILIKIVKLEKNVGLGNALNIGLAECAHPYIARMDTDDICHLNRFEEQINFLKNNPEISLLGTAITEFDEHGKRTKALPTTHKEITFFSKKKNPFNHMSVIFKKDVVNKVGGYKHHMYMEDYNLWLRIISRGYKTANLGTILLDVKVGDNMVRKRKGLVYVKSEIKLLNLKKELNIDDGLSLYINFIKRSTVRLFPLCILKLIYKIDRN